MSKFAGREEAVEPECNFESASTSTTSTSTAAAAAGEGDVGFASIATTSVAASAGDTSSSDAARAAEVVGERNEHGEVLGEAEYGREGDREPIEVKNTVILH